MSIPSNELTKAMPQANHIEMGGKDNDLQPFLEIHPPDEASKTPPILAFTRKREVEIPWDEIVGDKDAIRNAGPEAIVAIRKYFEDSWGFELNEKWWKDKPQPRDLLDCSGSWYVKKLSEEFTVFRPNFDELDDKDKPKAQEITEGFVIRHGTSGRLYYLIDPEGTLTEGDFNSPTPYEDAWENRILGVELVFEKSEKALSGYMAFDEIDLRPAVIQRKYEELHILHEFATKVKGKFEGGEGGDGILEKMIDQIVETTLDIDEIEKLQRKVLQLEIREYDVKWQIDRLASDAARLGYRLIIEDIPNNVAPDDKKTPLVKGKLYTTYKRTAHWTENVRVRDYWFFGWYHKTISIPHEEVVDDYEEVDTSKDILAEKRAKMIKNGKQVYVFEKTPSGFISTDGEPLHQIMVRCTHNEDFRRSCVVILPVYEESLAGERMVAKYAIYKRPLPGMIPTILPRLSLEESLTYRMAWVETQLGELLNSINLAPEEERTVTITKRFEQETTVARTSTSIFDIQRGESTDFASEMEHQTRREQESSSHLDFSSKASGGFGAFKAEASASGGTSTSLKDMSQAISKVANKAAKSVNSQNREEVSTTSTERTTIAQIDETVATIRNINQGRSLNLMFYRLYNKYEGGLYLEDLRFDVIQSIEVIAGSGVHESRSYSLDELPRMIDEFKAARLPFATTGDDIYTDRLIEKIDSLLTAEYAAPEEEKATSLSVAKLHFSPGKEPQKGSQDGDTDVDTDVDTDLEDLRDRLRESYLLSEAPIIPQSLLIAASGTYLDAIVGTQPSTEPYSEDMRTQTVEQKKAEVALTQADAHYRESLAQHLVQNSGNWIIGIDPKRASKILALTLKYPLADGEWDFLVDGNKISDVPADQIGQYKVNLKCGKHKDLLDDDGLLNRCLELHDCKKGIVLRRV